MSSTIEASTYDPRTKLEVQANEVYLNGTQALIRAVFEQMRRDRADGYTTATFVSGYPGSPLGGFDLELARHRKQAEELGVTHLPGHNEELAATSVYGTQVTQTFDDATHDGVVGVWYGKSPGLDRAADAIRHAQFVGTTRRGGVLALVGDDPGCKSSSIPCTTDQTLIDLGLPVLTPASVDDILTLAPHGIAMSRLSGLWTGVRIVTDIADASATMSGMPETPEIVEPELQWKGRPFVPSLKGIPGPPHSIEVEAELRGPRIEMAREYGYLNKLNRIVVEPTEARVSIVVVGHLYAVVQSALANLGIDECDLAALGVRLCHVRMPFPLDDRDLRAFAADVERVVLIEEKRPVVEGKLREALYGTAHQPTIIGKRDQQGRELVAAYGPVVTDGLTPVLFRALSGVIPADAMRAPRPPRITLPLLTESRAPYFCSGCPHNLSTRVPDGALVGGGIGCHGMTQMMDPQVVGDVVSTTHMGAEGAQWFGMSRYVQTEHIFQNLGDGTFFHSGQLAVQAAVAAGAHITYKLLYNSAIAMTGGQDPTDSNALPVEDITHILTRQGVARIIVTTDEPKKYRRKKLAAGVQVWDRSRMIEAQETLRAVDGVTVLIHDQQCAAELRRDRKRGRAPDAGKRVVINERMCEGCGDCGAKSNCLSVEPVDTEFGRKTQINQTTCNTDFSCLEGDCPSFVTVKPSRRGKNAATAASGEAAPEYAGVGELPDPPTRVDAGRETRLRMPGIGGTGVVTASQIIGTAAMLDGKHVRGMDQTGLSQKAGPVISDLTISDDPIGTEPRASQETVDLLLGFDILGSAAAPVVDSLRPGAVAVISTSRTPTGAMVSDVSKSWPDTRPLIDELTARLGDSSVWLADVTEVTRRLFGHSTGANVFLIGMAIQTGVLPVRPVSVQRAITLNGVAVEANLAAFEAGRWYVADQAAFESRTHQDVAPTRREGDFLAELVDVGLTGATLDSAVLRSQDLISYQSRKYARRYVNRVAEIARSEKKVSGAVGPLTAAVVDNLYKLMAYKDEYEVARLAFDPVEQERIESVYGPGARVYRHLHPPILRDRGMGRKLVLGSWFTPALRTLVPMRGLRGTRLDPFGRTEVRRLERTLIADYEDALDVIEATMSAEKLDLAVQTAALPDTVRGYEDLKLESGQRFREQIGEAVTLLQA